MNTRGLPLFSEPTTSREAAEAIEPHVARLQAVVLDALKWNADGLTAQELERATGLAGNSVRPRIIELSEAGFIETSGELRKTESGRNAKVWRLAQK